MERRPQSSRLGFRVLASSQPSRFLFGDADLLRANEAREEVRKFLEDADNVFPESLFLCLGGYLCSGAAH